MGGRIHGFLGGVLLTLLLTYYTSEYIKKTQQNCSRSLETLDNIINHRVLTRYDEYAHTIPSNTKVEFIVRPFGESLKDIWNREIITFVNWAYLINWYKMGEKADAELNKLTDKIAALAFEKK